MLTSLLSISLGAILINNLTPPQVWVWRLSSSWALRPHCAG